MLLKAGAGGGGGGRGGIEKVSIKTPTISLLIDSEKGSVTAGL